MTENIENNAGKPDSNGVTDHSGMSIDKIVAGVSQQTSSQGQRSSDESLFKSTRQIIIAAAKSKRQSRFSRMVLVGIGVALAGFVLFQIISRHGGTVSPVQVSAQPDQRSHKPLMPANNGSLQQEPAAVQTLISISIDSQVAKTLDKAVSLQRARLLYQRGDYKKAYYVYDKLRTNITGGGLKQQCLRDWLGLQMALSLQKTDDQTLMGQFFTEALQSRSLVVRAMASYHLALIQNRHQQFYESRNRAYQTLALLKSFETQMPATMEADCYFIAAESLTRQVLKMNDLNGGLPGASWSNSMEPYSLPIADQAQLSELLMVGMEKMDDAALMPKVDFFPNRKVGVQWSVLCRDVPLEQLFWGFASEADLGVSWGSEPSKQRTQPITVYLPFVDRLYLAEVISANAGLIWQYDGQKGVIYDPASYRDFGDLQQVLVKEAISMWQRFLLRYRNDPRMPNAQFCLGRLYAITDEVTMALGSYKLLTTRFEGHDLVPYALLDVGAIKTRMKDYAGARADLNELLIRYPDCMVADEALLNLAETTRINGLYPEAVRFYEQIFRLNINDESRRTALLGLGQCAFESADYQAAVKWFSQAIQTIPGKSDDRLGPAYLMAGRSFIELKQYEKAATAFRMALGSLLDRHEYVQVVLELVQAECGQENYLQALTILENIPEENLDQEDSCWILVAKTQIYRAIDLPETAITLLRQRVEFIADASLRAKLVLELAECYVLNDDLRVAQKELNEAIYDLPFGYDTQRGGYLLAKIAYQQGRYDKAQTLCLGTLRTQIEDESLRTEVSELLGKIYMKQADYDNAALAFAGALDQDTLP
ncbi:MAG: tetratricopeptide repeat protein [Planctomycetes bacterium]|nr:tetratricopeptide repeat protein [Planctomycetota bacterium]